MEKEIESSRQEINKLKQLLEQDQGDTTIGSPKLFPYEYRYRSPLIEATPGYPTRQIGKIRSHNLLTPVTSKTRVNETRMIESPNQKRDLCSRASYRSEL